MKLYVLGTSITAGSGSYTTYSEIVAREFGFDLVNLGVPGGLLGQSSKAGISNAILNAGDKVKADADVIIIEALMNDFRLGVSIGDFDSRDSKTFCGALNLLLEKVKIKAPNAKIFVLTSHQNADTHTESGVATNNCINNYYTFVNYVNAIQKVAARHEDINIIFTHTVTGIAAERENGLNPIHTYDKLHLTNEGARAYADIISSSIRRNLRTPKKLLRKVVYVPLDDRPCNFERVKLGAESMGIELITPSKYLTATYLDGQYNYAASNPELNVGNTEAIHYWLEKLNENNEDEIDAYLLSMDMLYSGGLVGSRDSNTTASSDEKTLNKILNFLNSTTKPIYIIDTVMRLAATAGFNGYEMSEYNATRAYGKAERKVASPWSVQSVIDCMRYDINGNKIAHPGLTAAQVDKYIAARERKIRFSSKLIQAIKTKENVYVFYGVDDSSSANNIQTNEIKYIQDTLPAGKGKIMAGTDELAMTALARISIDQFARWTNIGTAPKVKVTYFGGGENIKADEYDYDTLAQNVNKHLEATKCNAVTNGETLEILILTSGYTNTHVSALMKHLKANINAGKLTAIVDGSTNRGTLQKELLSLINNGQKTLPILLAYSSWNTVGNAVGLCLGHAIGRACFMGLGDRGIITTRAAQGQVDLLFYEYAKDMCYKIGASAYAKRKIAESCGVPTSGQEIDNIVSNLVKYSSVYNKPLVKQYEKHIKYYLSLTDTSSANYNINRLVDAFTNATMYTYYNSLTNYGTRGINKPITVTESNKNKHVVLPWGRHFEALLDTIITLKDK